MCLQADMTNSIKRRRKTWVTLKGLYNTSEMKQRMRRILKPMWTISQGSSNIRLLLVTPAQAKLLQTRDVVKRDNIQYPWR